MGLSVTTPRYTPSEMIDEGIGVFHHAFKENENLFFLKKTKGGQRSLIKGLVYETPMLSKPRSTVVIVINNLWRKRAELTISYE